MEVRRSLPSTNFAAHLRALSSEAAGASLSQSTMLNHPMREQRAPILIWGFSIEWQERLRQGLLLKKRKQAKLITYLICLSTGSYVFTASIEKFVEDTSAGSKNSRRRVCVFAASTH